MLDMHSHFFPALERKAADKLGDQWPWLRQESDGHATIMLGDEPFRPVRPELWDASVRLRALDDAGIGTQIVCATPILFAYLKDAAEAAHAATKLNDLLLAHCATDPRRLRALCQVPLQCLSSACDELERCMAAGHIGVQIGNHVGDRDLDDGQLVEFLQHCAAIRAPVLVHPWDMMGRNRMDRHMLQWLVAMPAETQLSILHLILSGAFERLPASLRICFAHGGGSFAYLAGRVDNAWRERDLVRRHCRELPSSYFDRFSVDSLVFDDDALQLLINKVGVERVMYGSDFPFPLGEQLPGKLVREHAGLDRATRSCILESNARRFFNLEAGSA